MPTTYIQQEGEGGGGFPQTSSARHLCAANRGGEKGGGSPDGPEDPNCASDRGDQTTEERKQGIGGPKGRTSQGCVCVSWRYIARQVVLQVKKQTGDQGGYGAPPSTWGGGADYQAREIVDNIINSPMGGGHIVIKLWRPDLENQPEGLYSEGAAESEEGGGQEAKEERGWGWYATPSGSVGSRLPGSEEPPEEERRRTSQYTGANLVQFCLVT